MALAKVPWCRPSWGSCRGSAARFGFWESRCACPAICPLGAAAGGLRAPAFSVQSWDPHGGGGVCGFGLGGVATPLALAAALCSAAGGARGAGTSRRIPPVLQGSGPAQRRGAETGAVGLLLGLAAAAAYPRRGTGRLRYAQRGEFYRLLEELRQSLGWAILQISHDLEMVSCYCDRVLCLNQSLICQGSPRWLWHQKC